MSRFMPAGGLAARLALLLALFVVATIAIAGCNLHALRSGLTRSRRSSCRARATLTRGRARLGCALFFVHPEGKCPMRADIVATAEAIKESVGLLRRHL